MKKLFVPMIIICLGFTGCAQTQLDQINSVQSVTMNNTQIFTKEYQEALQKTLDNASFTELISVYYDITSTTLPNYQLHTDVEIKAARDKAVSSVTKQHHENEDIESDLTVTRINRDDITYSKYHEDFKDPAKTPSEDRMVQFQESLSEAYMAARPYSSLYNIDEGSFDTIEWTLSEPIKEERSGVYSLSYNPDYMKRLLKEDITTPLANYIQDGDITIISANAKINIVEGKINAINIFCDGEYSKGDDVYNFIISFDRKFTNLNKTHPETISSAEAEKYEAVDQTIPYEE